MVGRRVAAVSRAAREYLPLHRRTRDDLSVELGAGNEQGHADQ
jgi:hypothetical protein